MCVLCLYCMCRKLAYFLLYLQWFTTCWQIFKIAIFGHET